MTRKVQTLWTGYLRDRETLHITDTIDIINTAVTPLSSVSHGLQLLTSSGDVVLPCRQCIDNGVTDNASYVDLNLVSRAGVVMLDVTVCIMCNGCAGHGSDTEYSIIFYVDYA